MQQFSASKPQAFSRQDSSTLKVTELNKTKLPTSVSQPFLPRVTLG